MADRGRPSDYSNAMADAICERISDGQSLRSICEADEFPHKATVFRWLAENEAFRDQYARARDTQAEVLFDEMITIADTPMLGQKTKIGSDGKSETTEGDMIEHRRLQIEARKWVLGRMAPKKYGDKVTNVHEGGDKPIDVVSVSDRERAKAMALLATKAAKAK